MEAEIQRNSDPGPSSGSPAVDISVQLVRRSPSAVEDSAEYWVDVLTQGRSGKSSGRCKKSDPRPAPESVPVSLEGMVGAPEAARICGISRTTWYSLKAAGRLPAIWDQGAGEGLGHELWNGVLWTGGAVWVGAVDERLWVVRLLRIEPLHAGHK